MIMNMVIAVILDPINSLNNNVALAFLGTTSEKLKIKCDWDDKTYETAQATWKDRQGPFAAPDSYVRKFFDPKDPSMGPYLKMVVSEMAVLVIDPVAFENQVDAKTLDIAFKLFNYKDSTVAMVASELSDLQNSDKGMDKFDAFSSTFLRNGSDNICHY